MRCWGRRAVRFVVRWLWGEDDLAVPIGSLLHATPGVWLALAVVTAVGVTDALVASSVEGVQLLTHHLGFSGEKVARGEWWRFFTAALVNPPGGTRFREYSDWEHLINNLITVLLAGVRVEYALGTRRFAAIFVLGGLCGYAGAYVGLPFYWTFAGGTSTSTFALVAAVLVIALVQRRESRSKFWYFVLSWIVILGLHWGLAWMNHALTNVLHLGGFVVGLALAAVWALRSRLPARAFASTVITISVLTVGLVGAETYAVRQVDPAVRAEIAVGREPVVVAEAFGSLWVSGSGNGTLFRIDPQGRRVIAEITDARLGGGVASVEDSLWVAAGRAITEIEPEGNRVLDSIRVPGDGPWGIASTPGVVWAALPDEGKVARVDVVTKNVGLTDVGASPFLVRSDGESVWVSSFEAKLISRLNARTGRVVERALTDNAPFWMKFYDGALWVSAEDEVLRLDPRTLKIQQAIDLPGPAYAFDFDQRGRLWVIQRWERGVSEIDPSNGEVVRKIRLGVSRPAEILALDGSLWIADEARRALLEVRP